MSNKQEKKFVPVMIMPFKDDLSIDFEALDELVDFYLLCGAKGLFANCLSSEMYQLSNEERLSSVRHIVRRVDGRVPVVATGSFGDSLEEYADSVKEMFGTGVSAVILISGMFATEYESDDVFRDHVLKIAQLTSDIPLGIYECPVPYKRLVSPDLLNELVNTGRLKYHKDTCLDIDQVKQKIAVTKNEPTFGLYDAYMIHAVESLKAGSAGLSCIQGNYFPELIVWLCHHYDHKDKMESVINVQEFFTKNMDLMHDTYPASAKYVLKSRGLNVKENCRVSHKKLNHDVKKSLDELIIDYQKLVQENKIFCKMS